MTASLAPSTTPNDLEPSWTGRSGLPVPRPPELRLVPTPNRSAGGVDLVELNDPMAGSRIRAWHSPDRWAELASSDDSVDETEHAWENLLRRSGFTAAPRATRPARVVLVGSGPLAAHIATTLPRPPGQELVLVPDAANGWLERDDQLRRPNRWQRRVLAASTQAGTGSVRWSPEAMDAGQIPHRRRSGTVVVLAPDFAEIDRAGLSQLCALGIEHVVVRVHRNLARVGPWVVPGQSPCLACLDAPLAQIDPHYPHVLASLCRRPAVTNQTLVSWAGAQLGAQFQRPDGGRTSLAGRCHTFDAFDPLALSTDWARSTSCPCSAGQD